MNLALAIEIDPRGEPVTAADVARLVPPERLRLGVAAALERSGERWVGRMVVDGQPGDCQNDVALHLIALRRLSARFPAAAITITADPDGGTLTLQAGSYGRDEEELSSLMASAAGLDLAAEGLHQRLYVSFRIEADAHHHLLDLVVRELPDGWGAPVVDSSPASLALGFEVGGDAVRLADLICTLRVAWRQEGSEPECLIEIEGDEPVLMTVRTWADWIELERRLRTLREASHPPPPPPRAGAEQPRVVELAEHPATRKILGTRRLSWIDADDQILCLAEGKLSSLSERAELGYRELGEFRRRADDSLWYRSPQRLVEIPPPAPGVERRLHDVCACGGLFTDTTGGAEIAETRLRLVDASGLHDGPRLARLRSLAVDGAERKVFALAERRGEVALFVIDLGHGWSHIEARPWHPEDVPTDVSVISASRVAITATRGHRSWLYLVERAELSHARRIALPCVEPQIAVHHGDALWITGLLAPPGPARCELFRVGLRTGTVAMVTAELPDAPVLDVVGPEGFHVGNLHGCLVATPDAVLEAAPAGLRTVLELDRGDRVTGMVYDNPCAVFVDGPRGPRLVLESQAATVPLRSPGEAPRFLEPGDDDDAIG